VVVAGEQGQGGTLHKLVAYQASRIDLRIEAEIFINPGGQKCTCQNLTFELSMSWLKLANFV
jgi:hypothetical protein